jgi:hypothetical protein
MNRYWFFSWHITYLSYEPELYPGDVKVERSSVAVRVDEGHWLETKNKYKIQIQFTGTFNIHYTFKSSLKSCILLLVKLLSLYNLNNTMDGTSVASTAYPFGAPEFMSVFNGVYVYSLNL